MSLRRAVVLLAALAMVGGTGMPKICAQEVDSEIQRRAKSKVQPMYPELARKMNISGTVKIQVVVAQNGSVKDAKVIGGHPVLANVALEAAKKWRFEPASVETTGIVDFKFEPHQ